MRLATRLDRFALLRMVGSRGSSWRFEPSRTRLSISRAGVTSASPQASPIRRSGVLGYVDTLQSVCFRLSSRSPTWKRPRRVGRRVARESADLRGGRHVSRTAASSAADPTDSYAPGKSHEISRCTPCPVSVPREDDTKCYAWGARVPRASTEKPHGPGPIAHTGTRRRRIIRYYAAVTRCATALMTH
jgi:hypothetical protein